MCSLYTRLFTLYLYLTFFAYEARTPEINTLRGFTVAQAEPSRSDVPSEVRSQRIQHQTLEIYAFITPDTELIFAASICD